MDVDKAEMCKSLMQWFQTLNLNVPHSSAEELSDGVAMAQALHQFAAEAFTAAWLGKIKSDVSTNWRLKMSNLKKIITAVYDYYSDCLNYSLTDYQRPDAQRIAEHCDEVELGLLLQLILGCAVNCADKQQYIKQIMGLEESLQQNIMRALQELESTWQGNSMPRNSISIMNFDYKILQEERDALAQKCFESEKQMRLLQEEKSNMQQEMAKLQKELEAARNSASVIDDDGVSLGPVQAGSARFNDLRRNLEQLKEELIRSETAREDLRVKCQEQEEDIVVLQQRIDELTQCTSELAQLKDEIDVLRESNDKLQGCEAQLSTYKKKLEDYNLLKKQLKVLEERSAEYIQQNAEYEQDAKKYITLKGQVELFKKEIQDLHAKLDDEMGKTMKLEIENKNLESNLNALQRTKDSLLKERENLRDAVDELKCGQMSPASRGSFGDTMSKELQPAALTEKLQRLESENKTLREGQGDRAALMQLLDEANKRQESLREQLKTANERILTLTEATQNKDPQLKDNELGKHMKQLLSANDEKTLQLDETHNQVALLQNKIAQLEASLATREQELIACDAKYRKSVDKAKEIIKALDLPAPLGLDTKTLASATVGLQNRIGNVTATESNRTEEMLMATAFYRLAVNTQRDAIDSKLTLLTGQGQTFLARQRQSAPRKSLTTPFKSK